MDHPEVISYLDKNRIDKQHVSWMLTTVEGFIVDVGTVSDLLIVAPVVNVSVEDFIPALIGFFPISKDLYLPNIQVLANRYHSLHLLVSGTTVWVLFQDVTDKIVLRKHVAFCEDEMSLLEGLEYWVLKKEDDNKYLAVGTPPLWLNKLIIEKNSIPEVDGLFPFLISFLDQIPISQNFSGRQKYYSGIWTQGKPDGEDIYLNAWVLQYAQADYLVIHPVDLTTTFGENIIQVAHENSLAYEQLQKTKKELTEVLVLKDQFVNIVSHDFRSPISTMINGISYLIEDVESNDSFDKTNTEIIVNIKNELSRLLDYNNKLYEWTKYNLDKFEVHLETISFDHFVMDMLFQFETRLKEKNITLKPIIKNPAVLQTDISLLQQVMINLIDNAIKFSNEGGEIQVVIKENTISVIDQGIGLNEQQIVQVMKGYYMESRQGSGGEQGTGVGLSIVSKILKTLDYSIDIKSEIEKGSTFTITFNRES